jgi:hypothetical protein
MNKFALVAIPLLLVAAYCSAESQTTELRNNRERWDRSRTLNYRLTLDAQCLCPLGPMVIEVRDGKAFSVTPLEKEPPFYFNPKAAEAYDTVDKLFDVIEGAIRGRADEVSVSYDEFTGYPTKINIDRVKSSSDDELKLEVRSFVLLQ